MKKIYLLKYFFVTLFSAFLYFAVAVLLLNENLVQNTLFGPSPLLYKFTLLTALIEGAWTSLARTDFFLLAATALLVGANIAASISLIRRLKSLGRISLATSGGTMLGFVSVGCASCGFSMLSLFGLSGLIALFPLGNTGLYILAITLLIFSLYYNIKQLQKPLVCKK